MIMQMPWLMILPGETDNAAMNHFITELKTTGYLHNHARMYLTAYIALAAY